MLVQLQRVPSLMQGHEHFLMVGELGSQMLLLFFLFSNKRTIEVKKVMKESKISNVT